MGEMTLHQLRCFVLAAEELHFGRAAQKLNIMPYAFGRFVRLLEDELGANLFARTTRTVALTEEGQQLLGDARKLLAQAESMRTRFKDRVRLKASRLRVGAIDSAAAGLMPMLLNDFRKQHPDIEVKLIEGKTIRLLPLVLSGQLDLAFVRPPKSKTSQLVFRHLFYETPVVALLVDHPLARKRRLTVRDIAEQPLIVPDRRSRPHSHDATMKTFEEAGLKAHIAQVADEKQTIVNLVAAGLGLAIVPKWTARMAVDGVRYVALATGQRSTPSRLPLAAAWARDAKDVLRDNLMGVLLANIDRYAAKA